MKITGKELKQFMEEGWPKPERNWYWDHELYDTIDDVDDDDEFDLRDFEEIRFQTDPHPESLKSDPTNGKGYDPVKLFRKWRRDRTHVPLAVRVPKDAEAEVREYLKSKKCIVS